MVHKPLPSRPSQVAAVAGRAILRSNKRQQWAVIASGILEALEGFIQSYIHRISHQAYLNTLERERAACREQATPSTADSSPSTVSFLRCIHKIRKTVLQRLAVLVRRMLRQGRTSSRLQECRSTHNALDILRRLVRLSLRLARPLRIFGIPLALLRGFGSLVLSLVSLASAGFG
ncbi:uncharacterized protein BJX67DRAFT_365884 [Aspergillus lucknowensis]|uniref:Uncharacterized protein n=1 Tax=Aspergillus lucknowensis TaxID=176173 RepID=A0ABR4LGP8_9EURO